ncbi:endonuclease/exonuclease/phosphatase (EEP) superfamily protein YafD [Arthrobacter ulcerisalmonis]|uniref:endonuclease/exonuclease/phosphatase family protein n=1 Tax=Arthrobacter sp. B1I2 TaxID=3042263 RepID=UPI00277F9E3A|nr:MULTISPECIES: endonuclease/exonuclease/phosphatase family protein [Arthrobacter]MDQ0664023.1 endonuclease/exonuclease/phosphatase (EEP) superfamily protein YafD [Arthrobacter ulcerisalmonis]MDQ0731928.1 endonuclease/exonuclease/phosphatase (EEP) superfamily protein YafD [Arthrobacter sp. B1I2]
MTVLRLAPGDFGTPWVQLLSLFPASLFPSMAAMAAALAAVFLNPRPARTTLAALAVGVLLGQLLLVAPRVIPVSGTARAAIEAPRTAGAASTQAVGQRLTVMALNVGSSGVDAAALLVQTRAWNVDILALPELAPAGLEGLDGAGIGADLPYRVLDVDGAGTGNAIFSRYPLQPMARVPGTSFYQTRAVAALPGTGASIQLTSVHIDSPRPGHTPVWRTELNQLAGLHRELPVDRQSVLLGDFNASIDHSGFRSLLAAGLADAAQAVGKGLAPTWPANGPVPAFAVIDHILVSPGITVLGFSTVRFPGTDHAAVVATLSVMP